MIDIIEQYKDGLVWMNQHREWVTLWLKFQKGEERLNFAMN